MHATCVLAKPRSRVDHRERLHTFPSQHAITNGTLGAHERGTFDPHIGRFLNTDPVIADIFDGQTLNAFSYVGNNPLTLIDPTGFQQQTRESIPEILDTIEQTVVTKYPDQFVPPPMEDDSADTDTGTMGTGANASPQQTPSRDVTASSITRQCT